MAGSSKVWLVQRRGWDVAEGWPPDGLGFFAATENPTAVPLRAFGKRKDAEVHRAELERDARREASPFRYGFEVAHVTSLDESTLRQRITRLGLEPPEQPAGERLPCDTLTPWREWWNHTAGGLTDGQREAIWDLLDRLSFYQVVEAPADLED